MFVERTFWPVGHGGFFSERIFSKESGRTATVVYDCGTLKHKTLCHERIDDFLDPHRLYKSIRFNHEIRHRYRHCYKCPDNDFAHWTDWLELHLPICCIDILFITHFDKDHINCISYLAKQVEIKNVVIPYYDDYDLLYLRTAKDSPLPDSADDIKTALNLPASTNVYRVLPEVGLDESRNDIYTEHPQQITIGQWRGTDMPIRSKTRFCSPASSDWIWAVFNYDRPHNTPRIRKEIQQLMKGESITPSIPAALASRLDQPHIRKKLNSIYGSSADKNNGSLVVFSGSTTDYDCPIHLLTPKADNNLHMHYWGACGFSYMGDYNAKSSDRLGAYLKFISPYKEQLGGIQIPHHGSSHNFSSELIKGTQWCMAAVASEDSKHPSATVWSQMNLHGFAHLVDEKDSSLLVQLCSL